MTSHAQTRRELELSLRSLMPERSRLGESMSSTPMGVAAIGFGGLVTGYVWGRLRARRARRAR